MGKVALSTANSSIRFEQWHAATCLNYSMTDCRLTNDAQFTGRITVRPFGALTVSDVVSAPAPDSPILITRHGSHIRKDTRDDFLLWLTLEGSAIFAQNDRTTRMEPGGLMLHDQTQPFVLEFHESHRAILVTIPRPLLTSRTPMARRCVARRIAAGTPIGDLAASVIGQVGRLAEAQTAPGMVRKIGTSVLDILATTIESELDRPNSPLPRSARQLEQIKRFLLARLDDVDLDIASIAAHHGLSPRTLNRLFVAEGTTPIRWLWRQRLAASYNALAEGHVTQVIDAAVSFGFSDPSHFCRAFKAEFGRSPQAVARHRDDDRYS